MNTDLTRNEALIEDGHDYTREDAQAELDSIHSVYRETLKAFVASAMKHSVLLSEHEIAVAMEGVGEALANEADRALEFLPNESYTPSDSKQLITEAHKSMVDSMAIKPINWSGVFDEIFRPMPTRGLAPQNPATLRAKGEL